MSANWIEREHGYKLFAQEFIRNGFNASQAAKKIWPNLTTGGAEVKGCRLLNYDKVMSEIIKNLPDLEQCAQNIEKIRMLAEKKGDFTNALRAVEDHVRMQAGFRDTSSVDMRHGTLKQGEKAELDGIRGKVSEAFEGN